MSTLLKTLLRFITRIFIFNIILLAAFVVWSVNRGTNGNFGYVANWTGKMNLTGNFGFSLYKEDGADDVKEDPNVTSVAIGLGITSKGMKKSSSLAKTKAAIPFLTDFLPSFCQTASKGYQYHFYIAYDIDDSFYTNESMMGPWRKTFHNITKTHCGPLGRVVLHLVPLNHSGRPAWAQNDAMMVAYGDGIQYLYRVNDDTHMVTSNWTDIYINTLKHMQPPLMGVVGPRHKGGNTKIMTYDFVHRTHIDIFGYYYPRIFLQWYADNWITEVYKPKRSKKIANVQVIHTQALGQRYPTHRLAPRYVAKVVTDTRVKIPGYLNKIGYHEPKKVPQKPKKVGYIGPKKVPQAHKKDG